MRKNIPFNTLVGKTLQSVDCKIGAESVIFTATDGSRYEMYHEYECCETVRVEDICGDINDLIGTPILQAEESTNSKQHPVGFTGNVYDSFTWTFYRITTMKGQVVIRWLGESNGYYSEAVSFTQITE